MIDLIGIAGAAIILVAFVLNQRRVWDDNDLHYDLCNLVGGILLLVSAYRIESIPFLLLNGVWTLVSLRDVFVDLGYIAPPKMSFHAKKRARRNKKTAVARKPQRKNNPAQA